MKVKVLQCSDGRKAYVNLDNIFSIDAFTPITTGITKIRVNGRELNLSYESNEEAYEAIEDLLGFTKTYVDNSTRADHCDYLFEKDD